LAGAALVGRAAPDAGSESNLAIYARGAEARRRVSQAHNLYMPYEARTEQLCLCQKPI